MNTKTLTTIKKSFDDKVVLDGVSFSVDEGNVFGLIGANGAGKTTIMNIISGLLLSDSGSVVVDNKEIKRQCNLCWWRVWSKS